MPVAGTIKEMNAKASQKASPKTMGALHPLWSWMNAIVDWVRPLIVKSAEVRGLLRQFRKARRSATGHG